MEVSKVNFSPLDYSIGLKSVMKEDESNVDIVKNNNTTLGDYIHNDLSSENIRLELKNQPISAFKAVMPKEKKKGKSDILNSEVFFVINVV